LKMVTITQGAKVMKSCFGYVEDRQDVIEFVFLVELRNILGVCVFSGAMENIRIAAATNPMAARI